MMTEKEWLECDEPEKSLDFLRLSGVRSYEEWVRRIEIVEGKVTDRKLRLFVCACCRRIWHLSNECCRKSIEVVEDVADGRLPPLERTKALRSIRRVLRRRWGDLLPDDPDALPFVVVAWALNKRPGLSAYLAPKHAAQLLAYTAPRTKGARRKDIEQAERGWQAEMMRDIFGNPFRPVTLDPPWRTSTVKQLAESIYQERSIDRLPILGDALEEAGCTNADILDHCRQPGEHVRGCWVVDVILGKS